MLWDAQVIAHRGGSAYAPENTLAAFERAKALGCRVIELDVQLSANGSPFVFHDETVQRITNGKGCFTQLSDDEISQLDVDIKRLRLSHVFLKLLKRGQVFNKEKILAFDAVLKWLVDNNMQANIEIKLPRDVHEKTNKLLIEQSVQVILMSLYRYWPADRPYPLITSFNLFALELCRSFSPELPLGYLMHTWDEKHIEQAKTLNCLAMHINHKILTPARARAIIANSMVLGVYTVNNNRLAKKLFKWGAQYVFSDYPDLLVRKGWIRRFFYGK